MDTFFVYITQYSYKQVKASIIIISLLLLFIWIWQKCQWFQGNWCLFCVVYSLLLYVNIIRRTRGSLALLGFLSINKYVLYSFHIYYRTIYIIIIIVPTELNFNIIFEFSADFTCYLTYYKPIAKKSWFGAPAGAPARRSVRRIDFQHHFWIQRRFYLLFDIL